jgi:hypothetical protein
MTSVGRGTEAFRVYLLPDLTTVHGPGLTEQNLTEASGLQVAVAHPSQRRLVTRTAGVSLGAAALKRRCWPASRTQARSGGPTSRFISLGLLDCGYRDSDGTAPPESHKSSVVTTRHRLARAPGPPPGGGDPGPPVAPLTRKLGRLRRPGLRQRRRRSAGPPVMPVCQDERRSRADHDSSVMALAAAAAAAARPGLYVVSLRVGGSDSVYRLGD